MARIPHHTLAYVYRQITKKNLCFDTLAFLEVGGGGGGGLFYVFHILFEISKIKIHGSTICIFLQNASAYMYDKEYSLNHRPNYGTPRKKRTVNQKISAHFDN